MKHMALCIVFSLFLHQMVYASVPETLKNLRDITVTENKSDLLFAVLLNRKTDPKNIALSFRDKTAVFVVSRAYLFPARQKIVKKLQNNTITEMRAYQSGADKITIEMDFAGSVENKEKRVSVVSDKRGFLVRISKTLSGNALDGKDEEGTSGTQTAKENNEIINDNFIKDLFGDENGKTSTASSIAGVLNKVEVEGANALADSAVDSNNKVGVSPVHENQTAIEKNALPDEERNASGENTTKKNDKPPVVSDSPDLVMASIRMVAALAFILGLVLVTVYLFKRYSMKGGKLFGKNRMIRIVSSSMIAPRQSISVVDIAGELIVIGSSNDRISFLTKLEKNAEDVESCFTDYLNGYAEDHEDALSEEDLNISENREAVNMEFDDVADEIMGDVKKMRELCDV